MGTPSAFLDRDTGLPQKLAAQIRAQIFAKRLEPGGKLPTERELGLTYGVARSVVREALTILAAQGIVRSRQGGGVYVRETLDDSLFDAATLVLPVPADAPSQTWLSGSAAGAFRGSRGARPVGELIRRPPRARTIRRGA